MIESVLSDPTYASNLTFECPVDSSAPNIPSKIELAKTWPTSAKFENVKVKKELKEKIVQLYNNKEKLEELSKENYMMSKEINNSCYKEKYKKYFLEF